MNQLRLTYIYLCTMLQLISAISNKSENNFQCLLNSIPWKSVPRLLEESFQLWQQPYRRLRKKDYFVIQDRATRTWRGLCRVVDMFLAFFCYAAASLPSYPCNCFSLSQTFYEIAINTGVLINLESRESLTWVLQKIMFPRHSVENWKIYSQQKNISSNQLIT